MAASLSASAPSTATCAACAPSSPLSADSPLRPSTVLVTALPSTRARLRLWMVFAAVGALALALLVGGLAWVRLYDDQLIRQTEGELIAQAIVVAEVFAGELHGGGPSGSAGRQAPLPPAPRAPSPGGPPPRDPPAPPAPPALHRRAPARRPPAR